MATTVLPIIRHHAVRIESRLVGTKRAGHAFFAHNRRRLDRKRDLHRIRHFVIGVRDRLEADFRRHKIGVGNFRLEPEYRCSIAPRGLGCHLHAE